MEKNGRLKEELVSLIEANGARGGGVEKEVDSIKF